MKEEYFDIMDDYGKTMEELYLKQTKHDNKMLRIVKKYVGSKNMKEIREALEEFECQNIVGIVNESTIKHEKQEEEYFFKYVYVDQQCGMCGDDWSGYVWIPLSGKKKKNRKCLKIYFNM